jgi:hypothetical protein
MQRGQGGQDLSTGTSERATVESVEVRVEVNLEKQDLIDFISVVIRTYLFP